jgi:hypothetical protein
MQSTSENRLGRRPERQRDSHFNLSIEVETIRRAEQHSGAADVFRRSIAATGLPNWAIFHRKVQRKSGCARQFGHGYPLRPLLTPIEGWIRHATRHQQITSQYFQL